MKKRKILQIILIIVLIFSGYKMVARVKSDWDFEQSQREVQQIREDWSKNSTEVRKSPEDKRAEELQEFQELKTAMPAMVGWVRVPGTDVDFPVVQGPDNDYYLNHDYAGNYNTLGAVYLDMDNTPDFHDQNSIIYGHNVRSGKVFHTLTSYEDPEFVKTAPEIEILTPEGWNYYEIRAVYSADPYDNFRSPQYEGEAWKKFTSRWEERNILNNPVPEPGEKILTLQTCLDNNKRLVIHGVEKK